MLLILVTCSAIPDELANQLAGEITESGIHRVGVVPRVLFRASGDDRIAEDLGPQAELIAQDISKALGDQAGKGAHKGKFAVVSHRVMREAFSDLSVKSLGNVKDLRKVGESTRADALLVVLATDQGETLDLKFELIPVSGDTAPSVNSHRSNLKSLTDFAYMGHSFEAQRWINDSLVPVGLNGKANLTADSRGDLPLTELKRDQPHPMTSESFPYRIGVAVEGREATVTPIDRDLYVALNENEKYAIQVWNTGPRPVYIALYIDGINTIGKSLEGPAETTAGRTWYVVPSAKHATINGYLTIGKAGESRQTSEEFVVARSENSLAGQRGFVDRLGLITAVVYDFIPVDSEKAIPRIGTTAGKKEDIEIKDWGKGRRGVMLAAITLRYATPSEIEALRSSTNSTASQQNSTDPTTADKPRTSIAAQTFLTDGAMKRRPVNSSPNETGLPAEGSAEPDESVPFPREVGVAESGRSDR
jgi:hypothetical protein